MPAGRDIADLLALMAALRTPGTGCPWDLEQSFATIAPYTVEEAYEVADAIRREDMEDLVEELGDLLFQVVFHARMAEEAGAFDFGDVVAAIIAKMVRRHPHVFGPAEATDRMTVRKRWSEIKAAEKAERAARRGDPATVGSLLGDVALALPALQRAVKLQKRAATIGFDWDDPRAVIAKLREELDEVEATLADRAERQCEEIGDLLFALANLARHMNVDPESALAGCNDKFVRRFGAIEAALAAQGRGPGESNLAEMEALWQRAKAAEA